MDVSPEDRLGTMNQIVNLKQSLNNYMGKPAWKGRLFLMLFRLISEFSDRDLSFDSDTLRAFTGVLQRISSATEGHILQGLPTAIPPISLMFWLKGRQAAKPRRRPEFPSYSWAGLEGIANWDGLNGSIIGTDYQHTEQWLEKANWIEWTVLTRDHSEEPWRVPGQYQVSGGALPRHLLERSGSQVSITTKPWAEHDRCLDRSWIKYPCLLFWTLHFTARILPMGKKSKKTLIEDVLSWDIEDTHRLKCGAACLDDPYQASSASLMNCLVISQRWAYGVEREYDDEEDEDEEDEIDSQNSSEHASSAKENLTIDLVSVPENDDQYHIFIVEEVLEGVYERRGIGWVQFYAVTRSFSRGTSWKQIILA